MLNEFAAMMTAVADQTSWPFGEKIEQLRLERGMSMAEAARRASVSPQRWRQLEQGREISAGVARRPNPSRTVVVKMATSLGWDYDEALRVAGIGDPLSDDEVADILGSDPWRDLEVLRHRLSGEQVEALLHAAMVMIDRHASPRAAFQAADEPAEPERADVWAGRSWRLREEPSADERTVRGDQESPTGR